MVPIVAPGWRRIAVLKHFAGNLTTNELDAIQGHDTPPNAKGDQTGFAPPSAGLKSGGVSTKVLVLVGAGDAPLRP
jgi:hypothetical protein